MLRLQCFLKLNALPIILKILLDFYIKMDSLL